MTPPSVQDEDFLRLWTQHAPTLRAYVRACVPDAQAVDEILQEVAVVAWRKLATLAEPAQFAQWAAGIARYEILMARRRYARDRLVLDEEVVAMLAEEGAGEMPRQERQLKALEDCVAKLPGDRRELALAAYAPGVSIKELAARLGRTEGSLYQLLARIRQELLRCVERTLAREAHAS